MSVPILSTKLNIPRPRANGIARPRLTKKLLDGANRPGSFVLISGPAGFGKTTLLSEFAAEFHNPLSWISLDGADNDPIQFWTYLITACQSIHHEIGESALAILQAPQPFPDETIPTILINDIVKMQDDLVLVLDDYHVIQNSSIHAGLAFILDHLPSNLHLLLSTRVDPPWPLARFRARDQLVEIRAADLRFTVEETTAFLNQVMGLNLSAADVAALETRTEGWIASLQLVALSMKGRADVTGFIQAFTGSHVYVAEYLIEEVLEHQPQDVKAFLLQTSILERLNAGLCEAVSGRQDSKALLKDLYQSNLFVLPLDDEGQWFRYHHLFADLLRARLQQSLSAETIATLHERAMSWYDKAGMTNEAIVHALAADNYSQAVQLVEKIVMPMILNAYFKTVEEWLRAIPSEYLKENPRTNMAFAWMHLMRRNLDEAVPHVQRLERIFSDLNQNEIEPSLLGEWFALQSMLLNAQGKVAESRDLAERALKFLPEAETQIRSMTYMGLADAYQQMLDFEQATATYEALIQSAHDLGDLTSEVLGLSLLGRMVVQQGKLHSAYKIATQAIQRIEHTNSFSPFSATLYGELAQVHYQWHQLEDARKNFLRSVQWSNLGGFSDAEIYHSVFLSRLFQMEGDLQASVQEVEKALNLMKTAAPALVGEEVVAQQVSIFLALSRITESETALKTHGFAFDKGFSYPAIVPNERFSHAMGLLYNSALRIVLYRMKTNLEPRILRSAIELAELLITSSLRSQDLPIALQTLLLRSQLRATLGDDRHRLDDVAKAVELSESEGFISIFVEEGQPIAEALTILLKSNLLGTVRPAYVQQILATFPKAQSSKAISGGPVHEDLSPIEPLTPRELEVLQLISRGDSNQTIAGKLVITLSAVKKHTGNIFNKLNVSSRTQAVAHARLLELLSTDN